jgi:putative PIN family toxin of toxin-antitoxin system
MNRRQIVIDTNVLVSGLRSRRGAAFRLLGLVGLEKFDLHVSVSLVVEYEAVLKSGVISLTAQAIDDVIDYLCSVASHVKVFYLWRPFLRDPKDDMLLELAVAAGCDTIVTYNGKDFAGSDQFNVRILTPKEFLDEIGELA